MSKGLINTLLFLATCVVLYIIAQNLIAQKKVPSLQDMLASSTTPLGSAAAELSSTTDTVLADLASSSPREQPTGEDASAIASSTLFPDLQTTMLYASKGSLHVFVADTQASQEQGLSDISSLPLGVGMLFVFQNPGMYGFWMKDMDFPLDLIWIDSDDTIAGVTKNALPSSYPFAFMPPRPITYVLEADAGSVARFGLTTGTKVSFQLP
jgi:uncharacterized membrane protein (UPF0127 family)